MNRTIAATALVLLAPAAAAQAAPPGKWTKVTDDGPSTVEVGLARTADGTLHVLWPRDGSLVHSALSADAKTLSGPDTVVTYGGSMHTSSALLAAGGSLRAMFAGLQGPVNEVLATATSADGGRTWSAPSAVSNTAKGTKHVVHASVGLSAATLPDGTPVSAWGSPDSGFHLGLDPSQLDGAFPGRALSDPGVGVDAQTGQTVVAWNRIDDDGVAAMAVQPPGGQLVLPNSDAAQLQHTVGVTGRIGAPGVYIGYTVGTNEFTGRPAVIRFGSSKAVVLSKTPGARHMSIAAGPGGRMWAFWDRRGLIYARRSNPKATVWGATVAVKAAASSIYDLTGEGSTGPLDVLARTQRGSIADYHRRILPGLTITARAGKGNKVTFKVTDAGAKVPRAIVSIKGVKAKKTGKKGTASFTLVGGRHTGTAKKQGYVPASTGVKAH